MACPSCKRCLAKADSKLWRHSSVEVCALLHFLTSHLAIRVICWVLAVDETVDETVIGCHALTIGPFSADRFDSNRSLSTYDKAIFVHDLVHIFTSYAI
jgi:hypothetical protein